jgi:hypothetical protein
MSRLYCVRASLLATVLLLRTAAAAGAQDAPPPSMHATGLTNGVFHFAGSLGNDFATQAAYPFRLARDRPGRFLLGATVFLGVVHTDNATRDAIASPEFVRDHGLAEPTQRWQPSSRTNIPRMASCR